MSWMNDECPVCVLFNGWARSWEGGRTRAYGEEGCLPGELAASSPSAVNKSVNSRQKCTSDKTRSDSQEVILFYDCLASTCKSGHTQLTYMYTHSRAKPTETDPTYMEFCPPPSPFHPSHNTIHHPVQTTFHPSLISVQTTASLSRLLPLSRNTTTHHVTIHTTATYIPQSRLLTNHCHITNQSQK